MAPPEGDEAVCNASATKEEVVVEKPEAKESEEGSYEHPEWYKRRNVHEKSLEDQSNCVSDWFLSYLSPLLRLGATKVLDINDIGVPSDQDRAQIAFETIVKTWGEEVKKIDSLNEARKTVFDQKFAKIPDAKKASAKPFVKSQPSVAKALISAFGLWNVVLAIAFYILSALVQFVPVMILEDLVKYFENPDHDPFVPAWVEVVALGILPLLTSTLQTRSQVIFQHMAVFVRTAVSTLLYKKSLSVSAAGRACTSTGQVVVSLAIFSICYIAL